MELVKSLALLVMVVGRYSLFRAGKIVITVREMVVLMAMLAAIIVEEEDLFKYISVLLQKQNRRLNFMARETCPTCGGSGYEPYGDDPTCDSHYIYMHCTHCGGSGYFDDDEDD